MYLSRCTSPITSPSAALLLFGPLQEGPSPPKQGAVQVEAPAVHGLLHGFHHRGEAGPPLHLQHDGPLERREGAEDLPPLGSHAQQFLA